MRVTRGRATATGRRRIARMTLPIVVLMLAGLVRSEPQAPSPAAPAAAAAGAEALKKSCDKHNAADCYTLAGMYRRGEGVTRDAKKAAGLLKKACEGQVMEACYDLAEAH